MYERILVPVDGSATSDHGLHEAIRIAQLTKGRLRLVHVIDELSLIYAGSELACMPTLREDAQRLLDVDKSIGRSFAARCIAGFHGHSLCPNDEISSGREKITAARSPCMPLPTLTGLPANGPLALPSVLKRRLNSQKRRLLRSPVVTW